MENGTVCKVETAVGRVDWLYSSAMALRVSSRMSPKCLFKDGAPFASTTDSWTVNLSFEEKLIRLELFKI